MCDYINLWSVVLIIGALVSICEYMSGLMLLPQINISNGIDFVFTDYDAASLYERGKRLNIFRQGAVLTGAYLITSLVLYNKYTKSNNKYYFIYSFIMLLLFLTDARAPMLIGSGFGIYSIYTRVGKVSKITFLSILIFAIFTIPIALSFLGSGHFISDESFSFEDRSSLYHVVAAKGTFNMFLNNPLLGVGLGNQPGLALEYFDFSYFDIAEVSIPPHNLFLELLSENGIVGFLIFLLVIYKLNTKYKSFGDYKFVILFATIFLPSMTLNYTYEPLFWFGMAVVSSVHITNGNFDDDRIKNEKGSNCSKNFS